ncbi:MAG: CPBP family intramembrane metalloprotease [Oscillospiraceae bacterium]|nr:CPBP family intramembrane metalloprotease [Oscillospiraceae bacterium]
MKKLYEKNELLFAILWIVAYVVIAGTVRGNFGDESVIMTAVLAVFAVGIFAFVKLSHLEERYGLCKWKGKAADYWFFIPPLILMTGNLWRGIGMEYSGAAQIFAVVSMLLTGFIEEMIFRGFLFRFLLKKDPAPVAITISAVTFGIGHIVNLFTGQTSLETVIQVFYAIAWGFIFTVVFYKSGSLLICIIAHSLNNAFSKFNAESEDMTLVYIYMGASIVTAIIYCAYLSRKPAALKNE